MTDPTPESVEDALMNRLVALVDAWRANGTEPSAMALASIAGIVRENMPPACDCDGGLFGAGPGDHAIGCPARPPEAPGERRPVAGWRAGVSANELFVGTFLRLRAGAIAWEVEAVKTSGLARWCDTLKSGIVTGGPVAAKLAAEDAAADLLLAGLAVLGRVK